MIKEKGRCSMRCSYANEVGGRLVIQYLAGDCGAVRRAYIMGTLVVSQLIPRDDGMIIALTMLQPRDKIAQIVEGDTKLILAGG